VKATPAGIRALTKGAQHVADPIGEVVMPMLAANAREMDEVET
jgi:hypothetical protein